MGIHFLKVDLELTLIGLKLIQPVSIIVDRFTGTILGQVPLESNLVELLGRHEMKCLAKMPSVTECFSFSHFE